MSMPADYVTYENATSSANRNNEMLFLLRRELAKVRTITLGQVLACTNTGGVSAVGTLTIQLMVSQSDGAGKLTPAGIVYNVPYSRISGGTNAVIMDPAVNDIWIIGHGDRDLSVVIASGKQGGPGSNRRFSWADAVAIAPWPMGIVPTQYVQFSSAGINIVSPTKITFQAPNIELNGAAKCDSTLLVVGAQTNDSTITASGDVVAGSISLQNHVHTGVQTGSSSTGPATG
jgi:hypothetical protein